MAFFRIFKHSALELKNIRTLAMTGVLIAMYVVLEVFCSIDVGYFKINFAFLALAALGMLYGPVVAAFAAIPCDIIAASARGYTIVFVFTLIAMLEAFIYGLVLYGFEPKKGIKQIAQIVSSRTAVVILCNIVLNTLFTYYGTLMLSGLPYSTKYALGEYFLTRIGKNLIELPIDIILMFAVLIPIKIAYGRIRKTAV